MPSSVLSSQPAATRHDWVIDAAIAGTLTFITCLPYFMMLPYETSSAYGHPMLVFPACVMFVAPLVLRRHYPLLMVWLMAAAGLLLVLVSGLPVFPLVVVPIAVYAVARFVDGDEARQVLWLGLVGSVLGPLRWVMSMAPFYAGSIVVLIFLMTMCFGSVVTPYAMGRRVREQHEADEAQRRQYLERQRLTLAAQEHRTRMAEVHARQQIARELHDIVAHSLSVMIVQAEGGRALAAKKPEAAVDVLDTIAETGREALGEARRIVAILRSDPSAEAEFGPAPTLQDLPDLVARTGARARLETSGQVPLVSPATALTVYRVVQEALTNVLKHAGPAASAWVTVHYSSEAIDVEIRDDGAGAAVRSDGRGNGLRGMHERVASMGGRLAAGPHPDGGFVVRALVPTAPDQFRRM